MRRWRRGFVAKHGWDPALPFELLLYALGLITAIALTILAVRAAVSVL